MRIGRLTIEDCRKLPGCRLTTADSENPTICNPTTICESSNLPIFQFGTCVSYEGSCTSSSGSVCSMFVSSDAGCAGAAAGAGRGTLRLGAAARVELRGGVARLRWSSASRCSWPIALRSFSLTLFFSRPCVTWRQSLPPSGVSWPCALLQLKWARVFYLIS